jgi:hypothetical protein
LTEYVNILTREKLKRSFGFISLPVLEMVALADWVRLTDISTRVVFEFQFFHFAHYMLLKCLYFLAKVAKINVIEIRGTLPEEYEACHLS